MYRSYPSSSSSSTSLSADRQAKIRGKNKVKFRTSSRRISFVCNMPVYCESVDFKVTGIRFMTVFITRRDAACFSLRLQPYCRLVSLGTAYSTPLSVCINQTVVMLDESREHRLGLGTS